MTVHNQRARALYQQPEWIELRQLPRPVQKVRLTAACELAGLDRG
jgi:hypothetical protein